MLKHKEINKQDEMRNLNRSFNDLILSTYRVSKKSLVVLHNSDLNVLWVDPARELF